MMDSTSMRIAAFLRVYALSALTAAAFLLPADLSFITLAVLVLFLIQWRWHFPFLTQIMAVYLVYFTVAVLFAEVLVNPAGFALALPLLYLFDHSLRTGASAQDFEGKAAGRSLTPVGTAVFLTTPTLLVLGWLFGSPGLMLASLAALAYLGVVGLYTLRNLPLKPVEAEVIKPRILAGKMERVKISLLSKAPAGGRFRLFSPYAWVVLDPHEITLTRGIINLQAAIKPLLAGPQQIILKGYCLDRWGLTCVDFEIEPVLPIVIPRARYASWLAKKYLSGSNPGTLPVSTGSRAVKPLFGMRQGLEYYGSHSYQPGDSLKKIDWKRSLKYSELVSREYIESRGQPVLMLINLLAGGAEQADKLSYDVVISAMNLAVEGIPASIAAYDEEKIVSITGQLSSHELVSSALLLLERIRISPVPERYLKPPDLLNIKANLSRLRLIPGQAARVLVELLQMEAASLKRIAVDSTATNALMQGLARSGRQGMVMVISGRNHDAEALSYLVLEMAKDSRLVMSIL